MPEKVSVYTGTLTRAGTEPADIARLLKSASSIVHSAGDAEEAMKWAVDLICEFTEWPVGHIFTIEPTTLEPVSTGIWHLADGTRYAPFRQGTEEMGHTLLAGLPGRIAASGKPVWIRDAAAEIGLPRSDLAREAGLGAAFGFPVITSRGVEGVMEFFSASAVDENPMLLDLISYVGVQLGGALDRASVQSALKVSEARLQEAQRIARAGSWSWAVGEDSVSWSDELFRLYGLEPESRPVGFDEYLGRVHPDFRHNVQAAVQIVLSSGNPHEHNYRIVRPDGAVRWVHARLEVAARVNGVATRLAGYCQDVSEAREREDVRRQARRDLASQQRILNRIARGSAVVDTLEALCREVESRFPGSYCSILIADTGRGVLHHGAGPSLPPRFMQAIDGLTIAEGSAACGTAASRRQMVVVEDVATDLLTRDYVELACEFGLRSVWSRPLVAANDNLLGTFAIYRSQVGRPSRREVSTITIAASLAALAIERDLSDKALLDAARADRLTGLPNRAWFLEKLNAELLADESVAVLFVGLDQFASINESLGHAAGDRVIVKVAERLGTALSPPSVLARFGGQAFTLLTYCTSTEDALLVASEVSRAFAAPFIIDGGEFFLSVSVGIALNDHDTDADSLVRDADAAMSAAKAGGQGRQAMFDERLLTRTTARLSLETELRHAIERDEFVMFFQPFVDLSNYSWAGAEALVRWQHPTRGIVGPDAFIPLAEETGLIIPLGNSVLSGTISQAAEWQASGRDLEISVNLSVVQLSDPKVATDILARLERYALPANKLIIEVTETAVMEHLDLALANLQQLKEAGAQIYVDDFGTGYSSIARLGDLPIIGIKIDRRFTSLISTDLSSERIVAAITDLAHALDMKVVVEGIETLAELNKVRQLGCDFGQGYLFGRPAPAADLERLLDGAIPTG